MLEKLMNLKIVKTVEVVKVQDKYNKNKVWVIKRYKNGNYAINQEICGKLFYAKFKIVNAKQIQEMVGINKIKFSYNKIVIK